MDLAKRKAISMPVGVVIRRLPGVTRWARWVWTPVAVLPGAGPAEWALLREDGAAAEYHAATVDLTLYRGEAEAYRVALSEPHPCLYVILRPDEDPGSDKPYKVHLVTASAHEGQLFGESGEEIVEKVPMPEGLIAWINAWIEAHYVEETFVKRKRRRHFEERREDGIGDARIAQTADVYRTPRSRKARLT